MAKSLQSQGVPIPSKLNGPNPSGPQTRSAAPSRSNRGTATQRATSKSRQSVRRGQSRNTSGPDATPDSGDIGTPSVPSSGQSVGLLEAEFLTAVGILVLLMFSDTDSSITDKMMSVMKRGTLICAVFFILAIVSGIGPNAAKSAKAFGALVIVAILVTSPMSKVITDLDGIVKNDWIGAVPSSSSDTGSGDTGTGNQTTPAGKNLTPLPDTSASDLLGDVEKAASATINGILPVDQVKKVLGSIGINIP